MNRKLFIALALVASTAYVACGGGGEEGKGANDPSSSASVAATPTPAPTPTETTPVATASAAPTATEAPKPKSLYERLGGKDAIAKVVDASLKNITEDKRINKYFAKTVKDPKKVEALRANLIDQICAATGGPCEYKGKDMKTSHKGMKIKDADFTAFVEDVTKALEGAGVGKPEQEELLGALGGMKGDIVEELPGKGKTGAGTTGSAATPAKSAAPGGAKSAAPAASPKK